MRRKLDVVHPSGLPICDEAIVAEQIQRGGVLVSVTSMPTPHHPDPTGVGGNGSSAFANTLSEHTNIPLEQAGNYFRWRAQQQLSLVNRSSEEAFQTWRANTTTEDDKAVDRYIHNKAVEHLQQTKCVIVEAKIYSLLVPFFWGIDPQTHPLFVLCLAIETDAEVAARRYQHRRHEKGERITLAEARQQRIDRYHTDQRLYKEAYGINYSSKDVGDNSHFTIEATHHSPEKLVEIFLEYLTKHQPVIARALLNNIALY